MGKNRRAWEVRLVTQPLSDEESEEISLGLFNSEWGAMSYIQRQFPEQALHKIEPAWYQVHNQGSVVADILVDRHTLDEPLDPLPVNVQALLGEDS